MALSAVEFAKKVKTKYPQYNDIDDMELTKKVIAKYPQYKDQVTLDKEPFYEKMANSKVGKFLGLQNREEFEKERAATKELYKKEGLKGVLKKGAYEGLVEGAQAVPWVIPYGKGLKGLATVSTAFGVAKGLKKHKEGATPKEAIKEGAIDALLSGGTMGTLGLLGKGLSGLGKRIIKSSIKPQVSEPILKQVLSDVSLTAPTKKTYEQLGNKTVESVKQLDRVFGKLLGRSKKLAIKSKEILNTTPIKKDAINMIRSEKLAGLRKLGNIKGVESRNMSTLKKVLKQINKKNMTIEDAFTSKTNMDDALALVYKKQKTPGAVLSKAEQTALRIRGKFKTELNKITDKYVSKNNQKFIKLRSLLGENRNELAKKLTSKDDIYNTLKTAMTEKDVPMLRRLEEIDNLLPTKKKFLKEITNKIVRESMEPKRLFPRRFEDIAELFSTGSSAGLRAGEKYKTATEVLKRLIGKGVTELSNNAQKE